MTLASFASVPLNTFEPSSCSPALEGAFRGIRIAAPARVLVEKRMTFPLCGTYRVTALFASRFQSMANEIVVVAVDAVTHQPYAANLLEDEAEPIPATFTEPDDKLAKIAMTSWFNLDLLELMKAMPRRPARYHVFAMLGEYTSNVVTVELDTP